MRPARCIRVEGTDSTHFGCGVRWWQASCPISRISRQFITQSWSWMCSSKMMIIDHALIMLLQLLLYIGPEVSRFTHSETERSRVNNLFRRHRRIDEWTSARIHRKQGDCSLFDVAVETAHGYQSCSGFVDSGMETRLVRICEPMWDQHPEIIFTIWVRLIPCPDGINEECQLNWI